MRSPALLLSAAILGAASTLTLAPAAHADWYRGGPGPGYYGRGYPPGAWDRGYGWREPHRWGGWGGPWGPRPYAYGVYPQHPPFYLGAPPMLVQPVPRVYVPPPVFYYNY